MKPIDVRIFGIIELLQIAIFVGLLATIALR